MSGKKKISDLSQVDISNANDLLEICTSNNLSKSITSKTIGEGILGSFTYSSSVSPNENVFMILSNLVLNSASAYNNQTTYNVGHLCTYQSKLYKCIVAIESPEDFNISHWLRTSVSEVVNQVSNRISAVNDRIDSSLSDLADEYDSTSTYIKGNYAIHNDKLYIANQDISVPEDFDDTKWDITNIVSNLSEGVVYTAGTGINIDSNNVISCTVEGSNDIIAEEYDNTKAYLVGDYCIYDNKLYKCTSAISASKWRKLPQDIYLPYYTSGGDHNIYAHTYTTSSIDVWVAMINTGTTKAQSIFGAIENNFNVSFDQSGWSNNDIRQGLIPLVINQDYVNHLYYCTGTDSQLIYYTTMEWGYPSGETIEFYSSQSEALADLGRVLHGFDPSKWTEVTVGDELKSIKGDIPTYTAGEGIGISNQNVISNDVIKDIAEEYDSSSTYAIGDYTWMNEDPENASNDAFVKGLYKKINEPSNSGSAEGWYSLPQTFTINESIKQRYSMNVDDEGFLCYVTDNGTNKFCISSRSSNNAVKFQMLMNGTPATTETTTLTQTITVDGTTYYYGLYSLGSISSVVSDESGELTLLNDVTTALNNLWTPPVQEWEKTDVGTELKNKYNYSTTEHVVGTWIDDKPIYEKTVDLENPVAVTQNTDTTIFSVADYNIDTLVNAIIKPSKGAIANEMCYVDNNDFKVNFHQTWSVKTVMLFYTKTTD